MTPEINGMPADYIKQLSGKMAQDANTLLTKGNTPMAYKHMKKYSAPLVVGEIENKTIIRYCLTPTKMAQLKECHSQVLVKT